MLRTLPLPDSLRQFVPAYKATRIIAEVMIESLPQCLLQSYILVTVMRHVRTQHESASEHMLMMTSMNGIAFAELLPRSITISVVTMLKTWIELVYSAREAGISVRLDLPPTPAICITHTVSVAPDLARIPDHR